ncbi:MAG: arsenate reductase [Burkholderiaceae bacterium]
MSEPFPIIVHGIETCDQVRKARRWLREHEIEHRYHDFRRDGIEASMLIAWASHVPWDSLLNRRGLAWRALDPQARATIVDQTSAIEAMLAEPTLIKRPVLIAGEHVLVGFNPKLYESLLPPPEAR